jgi:phage tail-like protein
MRILRTVAIAAAFLATWATASLAVAPGTQPKTAGEYLHSGHFKVLLDGVPIAVQKIEGTEVASEVVDRGARTRPQKRSGTLTLVSDSANSKELYDWRKSVMDGAPRRKSVSIVFLNDAGTEAARINFYNCFPIKWTGPSLNAKSSGHATESIQISYETSEMK